MDIAVFLTSVDLPESLIQQALPSQMLRHVHFFTGDMSELEGMKVAILGVKESRGSLEQGETANAPESFRNFFYKIHG
jgi:hypothetical protein